MEFTGERFIPEQFKDSNDEIVYEHVNRYKAITTYITDKTVLDAACGVGYGTDLLAETASKVYGVDINEDAINYASEKYKNNNKIEFIKSSVEKLPFEKEYFDTVISFETIEHLDEDTQKIFISEIKRVLKIDGCLVMSTPDKQLYSEANNYKNEYHLKEFYHNEFYNFLRSSFTYVNFYYQNDETVNLIYQAKSENIKVNEVSDLNISGKYIIAVCSDTELCDDVIGSSLIINNNELGKIKKRVLDLQVEVEEKNKWAFALKDNIKKLEQKEEERDLEEQKSLKLTEEQKEAIAILKEEVLELSRINKQKEEERVLEEQKSLKITEEQKEEVLELNKRYQQIVNSNGWGILKKYYNFKEILHIMLLPLMHPVKLFYAMDGTSLNKFIEHLKQGNYAYIIERLGQHIKSRPSGVKLELMAECEVKKSLIFPFVKRPKVSIVIPVYNQFNYTYGCLESILKFTDGIDYEIIIADDVSTDETTQIKKLIKNIKVVRNNNNLGFLLNCNNAAKKAKGEYIFFLNNDTNVQNNWLSTLLETIESDSTIGMVGSKLVFADGKQQEAGGIIWNDASGWNFGRLENFEKPEYNYVKEVDYISGAAIMIRAQLWKEIGGFDERYVPAYYEDVDLAFEVRKHGYKVVLQPKSTVVHFEGISNGINIESGMKRYQVLNKEKFYSKWKKVLEKEHFADGQDVFLARDRSKNKKHILVIDHYVPHYDKDAGSRALFHYLKLFTSHDMSVKFIGDNFYHYPDTPYVSSLEQMGIEVLHGTHYARNWKTWLKENGHYFDYVVLSRPHIAPKYIDLVKTHTNAKIIYLAVDLHYLREEREYKIKKDKTILESSRHWKSIEYDLMKKSDLTCFYSDIEVEEVRKEDLAINAVQVPLFIYDKLPDVTYLHSNRKDIMFVGGFTHNPNVDAVVWFVEEVLPEIRKRISSFNFYIIGSNVPEEIRLYGDKYEDVIVTGMVSDEELNKHYNGCRLAVAPLRYGAGMKGKVVESLYHGMPLVTTSIGAEGLKDIDKVLQIADTAADFAKSVIDIYQNEELGKKFLKESRLYCQKYFSVECADEALFKNGLEKL